MKDQTCQEAGYITARPLEGWLDNGWPGEGVFPHTVAYGSGMCILAGGFGGGTGDGGGTCVDHIRHVRRRHECRSRTFMMESYLPARPTARVPHLARPILAALPSPSRLRFAPIPWRRPFGLCRGV